MQIDPNEVEEKVKITDENGMKHKVGEVFEAETFELEVNDSPTFQKEKLSDIIRWKKDDIVYWFQNKIIKASLYMIRKCTDESGAVEKAKMEFDLANQRDDEEYVDGTFDEFQSYMIDLLHVFSTFGLSGGSAPFYIGTFNTLAKQKPLSPITGGDEEWVDVAEIDGGKPLFQNKRLSSVFKNGEDAVPHYLDAILWKDQNDVTFTGSVQGWSSAQNIRLPFTPKTFVVDVISTEVAPGDWESKLKDRKQLWEVFEYYDRKRN